MGRFLTHHCWFWGVLPVTRYFLYGGSPPLKKTEGRAAEGRVEHTHSGASIGEAVQCSGSLWSGCIVDAAVPSSVRLAARQRGTVFIVACVGDILLEVEVREW
jgi:hypothetical protein